MTKHVKIDVNDQAYGSIEVNGTDIGDAITGFSIKGRPGKGHLIDIELRVHHLEAELDGDIEIPDVTHDALVSLGWKPPDQVANVIAILESEPESCYTISEALCALGAAQLEEA